MRWLWLFAPLLVCEAQQQVSVDVLLVAQIKGKVAENLKRLPDYTCSETIERAIRLAPARKFRLLDTIRLEVALVEGKELYGWPGSNRISESELTTLVGGTIGNGDFGLLARSIFLGSSTSFTFIGYEDSKLGSPVRFDYRVPLLSSGYHLKVAQQETIVGYHGSFWVNPDNLDLVRLTLIADEIPEHLGLESVTKTLEFQRVPIGGSQFLLPSAAELSMLDFNGRESRNWTRFHDCRQYTGESVLSFADPAPAGPALELKPQIKPVDLPEDFGVELSLVTPIDSATAAVGDEVLARLEQNLRYGRKLIAPKGAIVSARILKLHRESHFFHLLLSPHSLDFEDRHADLTARDNAFSMPVLEHSRRAAALQGYMPEPTASSPQPIVIEGERLKLPRGFPLFLRSRLIKSDK